MLSNNGSAVCKKFNTSFINKSMVTVVACILLLIFTPIAILCIIYFSEIPLIIKIVFPIILCTTLFSIIFWFFCGIYVKNNGTIVFVDVFRINKFSLSNLNEISIIFNECENKKYSVRIEFMSKNGAVFEKDYANEFKNRKHKSLSMAINTIQFHKLEHICKSLKETNMNVFYLAIVDNNGSLKQI